MTTTQNISVGSKVFCKGFIGVDSSYGIIDAIDSRNGFVWIKRDNGGRFNVPIQMVGEGQQVKVVG
jgi:hypothetical protein